MARPSSPSARPRRAGFLRTLAAGALALVAVAGCGSSEQASTATPQPGAPATAGAAAFPVTLKHQFGETTIPARPTRVVTVGYNEGDFPLALGVVPLGEREFSGGFAWQDRPWAQAAKGGAQPEVVGGDEIQFEKIAALAPDLILGVYSFMDQATYDTLAKIAPTVGPPGDGTKAATWQEQTRITGQALGLTAKAEQVVADTETKLAQVKAAHPALDGKNLALDFDVEGVPYRLGTDDLRSQLFAGLGLKVGDTTETLTAETLQPLDQQALIVMGVTQQQLAGNQLFQSLNVVKNGKTLYLGDYTTSFAGALGYSSPLSLPYAADLVAPQLQTALAG